MEHRKSVPRIVFGKLLGLLFFLILLAIANALIGVVNDNNYTLIVFFINNNLALIVAYSLIFLLSSAFFEFIFPFNLIAPVFSSIGSMFLLTFLLRIFYFIDYLLNSNIFGFMDFLSYLLYPLVFFIVFIGGYLYIVGRLFRRKEVKEDWKKEKEKWREQMKKSKELKSGRQKNQKNPEWSDVGEEFKLLIYDAMRKAREALKKKR